MSAPNATYMTDESARQTNNIQNHQLITKWCNGSILMSHTLNIRVNFNSAFLHKLSGIRRKRAVFTQWYGRWVLGRWVLPGLTTQRCEWPEWARCPNCSCRRPADGCRSHQPHSQPTTAPMESLLLGQVTFGFYIKFIKVHATNVYLKVCTIYV